MTQQSYCWAYTQRKPHSKRHMHPKVHCSTVYRSRIWKQPKCPSTEERTKKLWCIHTREYYSAMKMNEMMPFAETQMDLETVVHSEAHQKEKNAAYRHIYVDGEAWWAAVHGVARSQTRLSDFTFTFPFHAPKKDMATHSSVLA